MVRIICLKVLYLKEMIQIFIFIKKTLINKNEEKYFNLFINKFSLTSEIYDNKSLFYIQ